LPNSVKDTSVHGVGEVFAPNSPDYPGIVPIVDEQCAEQSLLGRNVDKGGGAGYEPFVSGAEIRKNRAHSGGTFANADLGEHAVEDGDPFC
jgi:hypothetical protein